MTFKAYMQNIQAKTGNTAEDFWRLANDKGFIKDSKILAKHGDMLKWQKQKSGWDTCMQIS